MATLVLSTVGQALGGPLGAAVGAMVGQSIDQAVLGPGPRQGPRLDDLRVQSSRYGTEIPRLYGTMRVAGSVVWATDLVEDESLSGGSKGQAEVQLYAYRTSLAVALSSRRARAVKRIWADGRLIRGAQGDFKVALGAFRFHGGGEGQSVDPLIASIEGLDAPAYRGIALAVFEDLDLSEFGNRIPLMTFEVEADEGDIDAGAIVGDVCDLAMDGGVASVSGYALSGRDKGSAIGGLVDVFGLTLVDEGQGGAILPRSGRGVTHAVAAGQLACRVEDHERSPVERVRKSRATMPGQLSLGYHDVARDYLAGLAQAQSGAAGGPEVSIELPVVAAAADARGWAEAAVADRWADGERLRIALPPDALAIAVGDRVTVEGVAGRWIVCAVRIERWVVEVELRRRPQGGAAISAAAGRAVLSPDRTFGQTQLAICEVAPSNDGRLELWIAGSSDSGWKAVPVAISVNGMTIGEGLLGRPSIMGITVGGSWLPWSPLIDEGSRVDVQLTNEKAYLLNADDDALAMGANVALIGDELVQFGKATALGSGRYRLSRLLRGRRGTEWACSHVPSGERFLLLDRSRVARIQLDPALVGATVTASAGGLADAGATPLPYRITGEALRPLMPVHLEAAWSGNSLSLSWVGRSQSSFSWAADTLVSSSYRVTVTDDTGNALWGGVTADCALSIPASQLAGSGPLFVNVSAVSSGMASRPACRLVAQA